MLGIVSTHPPPTRGIGANLMGVSHQFVYKIRFLSFWTERSEVKNLFNMPIIQEILRFAQNGNKRVNNESHP